MKKDNIFKDISILYVEDEELLQKSITKALKPLGFTIISAFNGDEGLKLYQKNKDTINLIITDIEMPILDGLGMCEEIRTVDKEVPIILTTAYNNKDYLHKAITIGVSSFVMKPLFIKNFYRVLRPPLVHKF